jgi:phospholipid/cholesterol/gamma-HCH transport system ATP-binding protein
MRLADDPIVTLQNLHFSRGDHCIFQGINLQIPRAKITAIMGPSGVGKSTLLRLIGGQVLPQQGRVVVNGQDVNQLSRAALKRLRRHMGLMFQEGALFTDMNVFDNVAFLLKEHTRLSVEMIRDLVLMKLEAVGLRGAESLMISQLSGGMARRVALARAVMLDPELMLYDEPFTGQDPINRGVLIKLIRDINHAMQMTSVIVSHDVHEVSELADYVYILSDKKIIAAGEPRELLDSPDLQVKQFMQGLPDGPVAFRYPAAPFASALAMESPL